MPHHVTPCAALALAGNCKLWDGEIQKTWHCFGDGYLTLAKNQRCEQSPEVHTKENRRPRLSNPWSWQAPFFPPSLHLPISSHARCSHPPRPGEKPVSATPALPTLLKMLSCSSDKGEQNQMAPRGQNPLLTGQRLRLAATLQAPQVLCVFPSSDLPTIEDRFAKKLRN